MSNISYSDFVESMRRLYNGGMVRDEFVDRLLTNKKITEDEYFYIIRKEV